MMLEFDLDDFIRRHITRRADSLFRRDVDAHTDTLRAEAAGRSALVIGGAGSIGSAFIKSLLAFEPARLYVVDTSENGLTELTRDLRSSADVRVPADYKTYPIDFGDRLFARILEHEGPFDIVANFAAHKHVRSEKDRYSVAAMLQNNVLRNHALLELLTAAQPRHCFCVSSDKAANPVNVMGASKKLMEELMLAYADTLPVVTARFANVAFSQGSLLDGFLLRLRKGQPLSTPRNVRRYFVTRQESGELCLLACLLGRPGEIFFPKLDEDQMLTCDGIADDLLRACGLTPDCCATEDEARQKAATRGSGDATWPVYYFHPDTSGEKLFEEFFAEGDRPDMDRFEAIGVLRGTGAYDRQQVAEVMDRLRGVLSNQQANKADIVEFLSSVVAGFRHIETGKSLDQQM
jgi:FlaA1/EpsC-like NDP-sugar epimerase